MSGISTATFDMLDAYERLQDRPDGTRFPDYREEFCTDPFLWKRHEPPAWAFELEWHEFQYSEISNPSRLNEIINSESPGLYVFYVRPERLIYNFPQFALYVGISNERGSCRPLRERLQDYLPGRIAQIVKRKNIERMLIHYYGALRVAYSLTERPSAELMELEKNLHGFIYPRYSRRDYPVDIKNQQKAFGKI
ncbi:MAG: hypothetical protein DVB32_09645 [Verrucomicrobia bacterium]|nr:MAG: hypothetical protein DVB32_09645 [Verrucomicrobiota bacterium]